MNFPEVKFDDKKNSLEIDGVTLNVTYALFSIFRILYNSENGTATFSEFSHVSSTRSSLSAQISNLRNRIRQFSIFIYIKGDAYKMEHDPERAIKHLKVSRDSITPEVVENMLAMKASGKKADEIARALQTSRYFVELYCGGRQAKTGRPAIKTEVKKRTCLMCCRPFMSTHKGNFVCSPCKGTEDWNRGW